MLDANKVPSKEELESALNEKIEKLNATLASSNLESSAIALKDTIIIPMKTVLRAIEEYSKFYPASAADFDPIYAKYEDMYKRNLAKLITELNDIADTKIARLKEVDFASITTISELELYSADKNALEQSLSQMEEYQSRFPSKFQAKLDEYSPIVKSYNRRRDQLSYDMVLETDVVGTPKRFLAWLEKAVEPEQLKKLSEAYPKHLIEVYQQLLLKLNELRLKYKTISESKDKDGVQKIEEFIKLLESDNYHECMIKLHYSYQILKNTPSKLKEIILPEQNDITFAGTKLMTNVPLAIAEALKKYRGFAEVSNVEEQENITRLTDLRERMEAVAKKMNEFERLFPQSTSAFAGYNITGKKIGGANEAGKDSAWLKHILTGQEGLGKQDPIVAKVIAEKLAGDLISTATVFAAPIDFIQTKPGVDETGENTYVFSHKVSGFQGDLWQCVYTHAGYSEENKPASRPRRVGSDKTKQTLLREYLDHLAEKNPNIKVEFAEIMAASLWTGDFDVHWGNIVVAKDEKGIPHLHQIDYGGALKNLHNSHEVHPHSRMRHLPGFGPTNHFREFPRTWRVSMEMVHAIEKLIDINIPQQVENWLTELNGTYDLEPLQKFAKFFGIKEIPDDKAALLNVLKESLSNAFEKRRESLFNFAREIELSLCVNDKNEIIPEKIQAFVAKHPAYTAYCLAQDDFHFRGKDQKKSDFVKKVKPLIIAELRNALDKMAQIAELASKGAERIAEGSNSEIFRVKYEDKTWAVRKPKTLDDFWYAEANQTAEIFSHSRVFDNPNLVNVHSVINSATNKIDVQVMEFCEGGDLNAKPIALQNFPNTARQMLNGLLGLHAAGYSHNDVKPSNFFVTKDGVVKLGDLGAVLEREALIKRAEGTPEYLPPEFSSTKSFLAEKGDVFAFGVTLYNLVFGGDFPKPKAEANEHGFYFPEIEQLNELDENVRKLLDDLLAQCLEPDPNKRPSLETLARHPFLTALPNLAVEPSAADIDRYVLARAKNPSLMSREYRKERESALDLVVQTIEREEDFTLKDRQRGKLKDSIESYYIADAASLATEAKNIRFYLFKEAKPEETMADRMYRAYRHKNPLFICSDNDLIKLYDRGEHYKLFYDQVLNQVLSPQGRENRIRIIMDRYIESSPLHEPHQTEIYDAIFDLIEHYLLPSVEIIKNPIDKQITLALMMYETYFEELIALDDDERTVLDEFEGENSKLKSVNVFLKNILGTEDLSLELISETLKKRKTEPNYLPNEYLRRVIQQVRTGKFGACNTYSEMIQAIEKAKTSNQQLAVLYTQAEFTPQTLLRFNQLIAEGAIFLDQYPIYTVINNGCAIEVIEALMSKGCDIDATFKFFAEDKINLAAKLLEIAFKEKNPVFVEIALNQGGKFALENQNQILLNAAAAGCGVDLIRVLVKHGFDLNYKDAQGNGILHIAAIHENWQLFYDLIQSLQLDILETNAENKTPIILAKDLGQAPEATPQLREKVLSLISNPFVRNLLRGIENLQLENINYWLRPLNKACLADPILEDTLKTSLQLAGVELSDAELTTLVATISTAKTDPNMLRIERFVALDFTMLPDILQQVRKYLTQFNAEEHLGSAAKNMSLFDAFMLAFPQLKDELGLPVVANPTPELIAAVEKFMSGNPIKNISQAADIIASVNELISRKERIVKNCFSENNPKDAYAQLEPFFTMGVESYTENVLSQSVNRLIKLVETSDCTKDKASTDALRETHYQLNVLAQEMIANKPAKAKPIQPVDASAHYSSLLLDLDNAIHLATFEGYIARVEDSAANPIISRMQALLQSLSENRASALMLQNSTQFAFSNFIVSTTKNDKPIDASKYLQKNIGKMSRDEFAKLMKERAILLEEIITLIHENSKNKVSVSQNIGESKNFSIKEIFMSDISLGEMTEVYGKSKPVNIINDLKNELATVNKLRQLSQEELIRQILGDIQRELKDINTIRVLKTPAFVELIKWLSTFEDTKEQLIQQIEGMTSDTLFQVENNLDSFKENFDAIDEDLKSLEWSLKKLEADLALLQECRKQGIAEQQPYENLIATYIERRDALRTTITAYRAEFKATKEAFYPIQLNFDIKKNLVKYLHELKNKVSGNAATLADFHNLLCEPEFLEIMRDFPQLKKEFNTIYRQFINRDAAALAKMSRESFLAIQREDLLSAKFDSGKYPDSTFNQFPTVFNSISHYVIQDILSYKEIDLRTLAIKRWVDIAMASLNNHNDFNVTQAIFAALNKAEINRLKSTFEGCDQSTRDKLEYLSKLLDPSSSYKSAREAYNNTKGPFVPYAGTLSTDMTFVHDGNAWIEEIKTAESKGTKLEMYTAGGCKTAVFFDVAQQLLSEAPPITEFNAVFTENLRNLEIVPDNQSYDLSLELEPRDQKNPTISTFLSGDTVSLFSTHQFQPEIVNLPTTKELLNLEYEKRAHSYLAELETLLTNSLKQSANEILDKSSPVKLAKEKLSALYEGWKTYIEADTNNPLFKQLELLQNGLKSYFDILNLEVELDNPDLAPERVAAISQLLIEITQDSEKYNDTLPIIYSLLQQRIVNTKEKLLQFEQEKSSQNTAKLEELKKLIEPRFQLPASSASTTLLEYTKNLTARMENVQTIIDAKTFAASFFGFNSLTDEQKVLLNGRLVINLNTSLKTLTDLEKKLTAEQRNWQELLTSLHLELEENTISESIQPSALADRIISKRVELQAKTTAKLAEMATAKTQLESARGQIAEKFLWVRDQHTSTKQLKVVGQFVLNTQNVLRERRPDDIANLRQDLLDQQKRLEQVTLWLMSLPQSENEISTSFKTQYVKNASRIEVLRQELAELQISLQQQIQQINQTVTRKTAPFTQPDTTVPAWDKSPPATLPAVKPTVTSTHIPLSVYPHQPEPAQTMINTTTSTAAATSSEGGKLGTWETDSQGVIKINLLPDYVESEATIENALRNTAALSETIQYEVAHPDSTVRDKTCICLIAMGKEPYIQNAKGLWVQFKPDSEQQKQIEEKQEKLAEQYTTSAAPSLTFRS